MTPNGSSDYTPVLRQLMKAIGVESFQALSSLGISQYQVKCLRRGQIQQFQLKTLSHLSRVFRISLSELVQRFSTLDQPIAEPEDGQLQRLQREYQRLATELQQQQQTLRQELQQEVLQILESFLLQWPNAVYAARNNPQLPAVNLIPLTRPIENLLQHWGIEPIGEVGAVVNFDPQWHQLLEGGNVEPGTPVKIRYVGYKQKIGPNFPMEERLLYRAKVGLIN